MPTVLEEFPLCNCWPFSHDWKIRIWSGRGNLQIRNCLIWNSRCVMLCVTACSVSWVNRKTSYRCNVPLPTSISEGASLFALHRSRFPTAVVRGQSVWETWPFFQRLEKSSSLDSSHSKVHESLLLTNNILSVSISARSQRCDFWLLQPHDGLVAPSFWFHSAHRCCLTCLSPLSLSAAFILVLFPETGRRNFPNRHKDDFSNEWSCINCKKNTRVNSAAIRVFYKASFCSYGVLKRTAALAQFACLVNFLAELLEVFSLLLHWWCY